MPGEREQRTPQNKSKAFRMSGAGEAPAKTRAPRKKDPAEPAPDYDYEPRRKPKGYRLIKTVVVVAVLAWFFVMGILVGRGSAPVRFEIDGLRDQLVTASAAISERIAQIRGGESEVSFYDNLGTADADITISDPRSYRPEYSVAPAGTGEAESGETAADADAAEVVVAEEDYDGKTLEPKVKPKTEFSGYVALKQAGREPDAAQAQASPPMPPPERPQPPVREPERGSTVVAGDDVPQGSFSVQVAALRNEADAKKFLQSLGQKGFSGRVEKTVVGEGVWYRIRIGVYKTRAAAEEDLQRLIKTGIKSPMIVTN